RRLASRELADQLTQAARAVGVADELVDPVFLFLKPVQALDLTTGPNLFERPGHRELELVEVLEGLLEIVGGAGLHRLYRALDLAEPGDDDDRGLRVLRYQRSGIQWWQVTQSSGALAPRVAFCSRWHSMHQPIVRARDGGLNPTKTCRSWSNAGPVSAPTTRMRSMGPWQVWHAMGKRTCG